jgi:hypothetical protein
MQFMSGNQTNAVQTNAGAQPGQPSPAMGHPPAAGQPHPLPQPSPAVGVGNKAQAGPGSLPSQPSQPQMPA